MRRVCAVLEWYGGDANESSKCLEQYKLFLQNKICSKSKDGENAESYFLEDFCNVTDSNE